MDIKHPTAPCMLLRYDTILDAFYFNVRSKANMSRLNLPHGTDT